MIRKNLLRFRCTGGTCVWKGPVNEEGLPDGMGEMSFRKIGSIQMTYFGEFRNGVRNSPSAIFKTKNWSIIGGPWINDRPSRKGKFVIKEVGANGEMMEYVGSIRVLKSKEVKNENNRRSRCCFGCTTTKRDEIEMVNSKYMQLNLRMYKPSDFLKHGLKCETSIVGKDWESKLQTYIGSFKNNRRHGKGVMMNYVRDFQYYGSWKYGLFHGRIILNFVFSHTYLLGRGILIYRNGDVYEGSFFEGRRRGTGSLLTSSGTKITGTWEGRTIKNGKNEFVKRDSRTLPYMQLLNFKERNAMEKDERRMGESVLDITKNFMKPNPWKEMIEKGKLEEWLVYEKFLPPPDYQTISENNDEENQKGKGKKNKRRNSEFLSEEEERYVLPYWSSLFSALAKKGLTPKSERVGIRRPTTPRPTRASKEQQKRSFRKIILPDIMRRIKKKTRKSFYFDKRGGGDDDDEEEECGLDDDYDDVDDDEIDDEEEELELLGFQKPMNYFNSLLYDFKGWFFSHFYTKNRQVLSVSLRSARSYIICFVAALETAISEIFLKYSPQFGASYIPRITLRVYVTSIIHQLLYPIIFPMYITQNSEKNIVFKTKLSMLRKGDLIKNMNLQAVFPPLAYNNNDQYQQQQESNNKSYRWICERDILYDSISILNEMDSSNNLLSKLDLLDNFRNSVFTEIKAHLILKELIDKSCIVVISHDDYHNSSGKEDEDDDQVLMCRVDPKNIQLLKNEIVGVLMKNIYETPSDQYVKICEKLIKYHKMSCFDVEESEGKEKEEEEKQNHFFKSEEIISIIDQQQQQQQQISESEEIKKLRVQLLEYKNEVNLNVIGADQLTPSYLYCITKSKMNHLANFQYLKDWMSEKWLTLVGSPSLTFLPLFESFFQIVIQFDPNVVDPSHGGFVSSTQFRDEMRLMIVAARERSLSMNWIIEFFSCISVEVGSFRILKLGDHVKKIGMILLQKEKYGNVLFKNISEIRLGIPYFLKYQKSINIHSIEIVNLKKTDLSKPFEIGGKLISNNNNNSSRDEQSLIDFDDQVYENIGDGDAIKIVFKKIYPSNVYENLANVAIELIESYE